MRRRAVRLVLAPRSPSPLAARRARRDADPAGARALGHRSRGVSLAGDACGPRRAPRRLRAADRASGAGLHRSHDRRRARSRTGRCARSSAGASAARGIDDGPCCSSSATTTACASRSGTAWRIACPTSSPSGSSTSRSCRASAPAIATAPSAPASTRSPPPSAAPPAASRRRRGHAGAAGTCRGGCGSWGPSCSCSSSASSITPSVARRDDDDEHRRRPARRRGLAAAGAGASAAAAGSRAAAAAPAAAAPRGHGDGARSSTGSTSRAVEAAIAPPSARPRARSASRSRASISGATCGAPPSAPSRACACTGPASTTACCSSWRRGGGGSPCSATPASTARRDRFWSQIAELLADRLPRRRSTSGLERAIATIGEQLAAHFPPDPRATTSCPTASRSSANGRGDRPFARPCARREQTAISRASFCSGPCQAYRGRMNRFAPVIAITVAVGCSGGGSGGSDLPSFNDISSAPSKDPDRCRGRGPGSDGRRLRNRSVHLVLRIAPHQ